MPGATASRVHHVQFWAKPLKAASVFPLCVLPLSEPPFRRLPASPVWAPSSAPSPNIAASPATKVKSSSLTRSAGSSARSQLFCQHVLKFFRNFDRISGINTLKDDYSSHRGFSKTLHHDLCVLLHKTCINSLMAKGGRGT